MTVQCGTTLYKDEVCFLNTIDNKLYLSNFNLTQENINEMQNVFITNADFKEAEIVKIEQKKVYKLN